MREKSRWDRNIVQRAGADEELHLNAKMGGIFEIDRRKKSALIKKNLRLG